MVDFAKLYRSNRLRLVGLLIKRLGCRRGEADDLVQQAFLLAITNSHQLKQAKHATGWITTIAVRLASNDLQRRHIFSEMMDSDDPPESGKSPLQEIVDLETKLLVREAVENLPEHFRCVIWDFYYQRKLMKSIARQRGLPIGTVKSRLSKAKGLLRKSLQELCPSQPG